MLTYILYTLFILACLILVVVILLQPGKADAGALFSNTLSSTAFGPRGTASLLAKITIGAAVAFMLIALALGLPILTGSRSVLQSESAPAAPPADPAAQRRQYERRVGEGTGIVRLRRPEQRVELGRVSGHSRRSRHAVTSARPELSPASVRVMWSAPGSAETLVATSSITGPAPNTRRCSIARERA